VETLWGAIVGFLVGAVLGPLIRPWSTWLERQARHLWRENPLIVHVERDQSLIWAGAPPWVGFSYFFRDTVPHQLPPSACFDWSRWAERHGGVDVGVTILEVTIQAKTDVSVVVDPLRVRNQRREPPRGVFVTCPAGGADLTPRRFSIELDTTDPPIVDFLNADGDFEQPPRLTLSAGEIERFHIWATARSPGWNEWTLELPLLVEGRRRIVSVGDGRAPFVTVGPDDQAEEFLWYGEDVGWVARDDKADAVEGLRDDINE
jgi:hypothetical protein